MLQVEVNCQCTARAPIIGTNNETAFTVARNRRLYLNSANPAPCNGTINGWRYCFYNPGTINNNRNYITTFAVYRVFGTGGSARYQKVSNSESVVSWRGSNLNALPQSFNCFSISVDSFTIQAGDIVAACVYDPAADGSTTKQLDIVGQNATGYSLMRMNDESQCRRNSLPSNVLSSQLNGVLNSWILHVHANITGS